MSVISTEHENPIIRCKKPDCDKTFTKYYVDKNGNVHWTYIQEYCCRIHNPACSESIRKAQLSNIGKKRSPETIEKLRLLKRGRHLSEEHKRNLRLAMTGKKIHENTRLALKVGVTGGLYSWLYSRLESFL